LLNNFNNIIILNSVPWRLNRGSDNTAGILALINNNIRDISGSINSIKDILGSIDGGSISVESSGYKLDRVSIDKSERG